MAEHELTKIKVAIKILNKKKINEQPDMAEKIQREIKILKLCKHAHICRLYNLNYFKIIDMKLLILQLIFF